jgi:sporulation related protein
MAVDANRLGAGRRLGPDPRAAKEKRQKIVLAVGLVLLVGLGALQGPKTLRQLRGSQASAPAPAATAPTATSAAGPAGTEVSRADFGALRRFPVKDPFVVQVRSPSPAAVAEVVGNPPPVRATHFVVKDPFVTQVTPIRGSSPAPPAAKPVHGSGKGYIVVLESVARADGPGDAHAALAAARKTGLKASVLDSTKYATLRSGYYAVYLGPFATVDQVLKALSSARSHGYVSAYARRLGG